MRRSARKTARRYWLLAGLICLWPGLPAAAQTSILDSPDIRAEIKTGLDALYDMQFAPSRASFNAVTGRFPEHPIGPFLEGLTLWWEILLDLSDTSNDEAFYGYMTEVVRRSDEVLAEDPGNFDAMFFKGMALGFRGRLRSNRRHWIRAAADGHRAMRYVLDVADSDTTNHDYVLGRALYEYYAALIPVRYPFARAITTFLPPGDRARGMAGLQRTASQGYFMRTEALYFLVQINYLYERDFNASVDHVTELRSRHPDNPFFHTLEGRIYASWGFWPSSAQVFQSVLERYMRNRPGYNAAMAEQALYYLARARMEAGEPNEALSYLLSLEALTARSEVDTYFKAAGRLLQGMVHDVLDQRDRAITRYEEVLAMPDRGTLHARAHEYLRNPYRR